MAKLQSKQDRCWLLSKSRNKPLIGLPQLIIYMGPIQKARENCENKAIRGICQMEKRFPSYVSAMIAGYFGPNHSSCAMIDRPISTYIETILFDAVHSSRHTTPMTHILRYEKDLARSWKFSEDEEDNGDDREIS